MIRVKIIHILPNSKYKYKGYSSGSDDPIPHQLQLAVILYCKLSPGGYHGDPFNPPTCSSDTANRYKKYTYGLLLDRIDIHVEVPRMGYEQLSDDRFGEPSLLVQASVEYTAPCGGNTLKTPGKFSIYFGKEETYTPRLFRLMISSTAWLVAGE